MDIIPAILTHTEDEFISQLQALVPYYQRFQIDIADGKFVPNTTLQIEEITHTLKKINNIHTIGFDFHLMVQDYENEITKLSQLKTQLHAHTIFIHTAVTNPESFQKLTSTYTAYDIGLVLNPEDSGSQIANTYDMKKIQSIQVMTIHPGFQGQEFIPATLQKIAELRQLGFTNSIYIDGGVNEHSLPIIASLDYKPDFVCIGSYLTHHVDRLQERIDNLKDIS